MGTALRQDNKDIVMTLLCEGKLLLTVFTHRNREENICLANSYIGGANNDINCSSKYAISDILLSV